MIVWNFHVGNLVLVLMLCLLNGCMLRRLNSVESRHSKESSCLVIEPCGSGGSFRSSCSLTERVVSYVGKYISPCSDSLHVSFLLMRLLCDEESNCNIVKCVNSSLLNWYVVMVWSGKINHGVWHFDNRRVYIFDNMLGIVNVCVRLPEDESLVVVEFLGGMASKFARLDSVERLRVVKKYELVLEEDTFYIGLLDTARTVIWRSFYVGFAIWRRGTCSVFMEADTLALSGRLGNAYTHSVFIEVCGRLRF